MAFLTVEKNSSVKMVIFQKKQFSHFASIYLHKRNAPLQLVAINHFLGRVQLSLYNIHTVAINC